MVKAQVENFKITKIIHACVVNLSTLQHNVVPRDKCLLYHSNQVYDKLEHFFQEYNVFLKDVDHILVELQPPGGLVHVEQLLFGHFRDRVKLIPPRSMHKHFQIGHLDYDHRKLETTRIAEPWLKLQQDWSNRCKIDDMADALCLLLCHLSLEKTRFNVQQEKIQAEKQRQEYSNECTFDGDQNLNQFFDKFRFHK